MNNLVAASICAGCLLATHFAEPYYIVGIPTVIALGWLIGYFITRALREDA